MVMRGKTFWCCVVMASALLGCASVEPDPIPSDGEPRGGTAVERELYPAELVMDHQAAIGLSDEQREAIRTELRRAQTELVDAELDLRAHREALARTLAPPRVDEAAAMRAAEQVVDGERAIKLSHMQLLVRIKNVLTPAQQRALDRLR
jgi:uncharacterized membrane protein